MLVRSAPLNLRMIKLDPKLLPDLDQLREIMKITGTPTCDFVVKLQSQDVCVFSSIIKRAEVKLEFTS